LAGGTATTTDEDRRHMMAALALSLRHLGQTWPNPSVGCVIVHDGRVVGRGVTARGGRPHAETEALKQAGEAARGATAYVSLEPCAHQGQTGPCCDALIAAGIARVVVPMRDPDPRTAGEGLARLIEAGVVVDEGSLAAEAADIHAGFASRIVRERPLVTAKIAATLDGRVATAGGDSKWITGPEARARGHLLRANHDAVMIGSGTALADNPVLTCRLPGMSDHSPLRVVVDSGLGLPEQSGLVLSARETPLLVLCGNDVPAEQEQRLASAGVEIAKVGRRHDGRLDTALILSELGGRGVTRLLIEGGPRLVTSFLADHLVDRLAWFSAPALLGNDGTPAVRAMGIDSISRAASWRVRHADRVGDDGLVMLDAVRE